MKNRRSLFISVLVITIISVSFAAGKAVPEKKNSLAVVVKTVLDVQMKTDPGKWERASNGDVLGAGDQMKTGLKSFALIKFEDDTFVRLREESELMVNSEGQRGSMIKTVQLNNGSFGFDVKKQKNEQFRLTSPTSVASIRGTKGWWASRRGRDTLLVLEGLVNLKNNISGEEVDVTGGYMGFSDESGHVTLRKATDRELSNAASSLLGATQNELNFEMKDPKGNKKELKLKYK